jgi:pyrimidine deaminase RibD-like protein
VTTVIINEILSHQLKSQEDLDRILTRCCELVLNGQAEDPDHWGMVAACVVLPNGEEVYGVNHKDSEGLHIHAERAALNACETADHRCMIITTLSPCNRPMDNRMGESCTDLIEYYGISLVNVYCGYKDPTQKEDGVEETNNPKLRELCKQLADTFLNK